MLNRAQQERVDSAVRSALRATKTKAAVERLIVMRRSEKYTSYAQYLLAYTPTSYGVAYVNIDNLSEPKVVIHDPSTPAGKKATAVQMERLDRAEARMEKKTAAKSKAAKPVSQKEVIADLSRAVAAGAAKIVGMGGGR